MTYFYIYCIVYEHWPETREFITRTIELWNRWIIGKQRALSLEVTCNFRLYFKKGQTSVKLSWKNWIITSNYHCLHTWVPSNNGYGWNMPNVKAQCSLFIYTTCYIRHDENMLPHSKVVRRRWNQITFCLKSRGLTSIRELFFY